MCNCKWWGVLLALVVIVFTLWTPGAWATWLVVIAGVIMLFHAFMHGESCCSVGAPKVIGAAKPKAKKKKKK